MPVHANASLVELITDLAATRIVALAPYTRVFDRWLEADAADGPSPESYRDLRSFEETIYAFLAPGGGLDALLEPVRQLEDEPTPSDLRVVHAALAAAECAVGDALEAWGTVTRCARSRRPCEPNPAFQRVSRAPSSERRGLREFLRGLSDLLASAAAVGGQIVRFVRQVVDSELLRQPSGVDANDVRAYLKGLANVLEVARLGIEGALGA